ncbi:MAG: NfeD family protein [Kiritimatiellia bacterium]
MTGCGWTWLYIGAGLMLLELASPGFVIFFFGLAAATVGLIRFGVGDSFSPVWQLAAFSILSILYLLVLRRYVKRVFSGATRDTKADFDNEYVGRAGKVTAAIAPPLTGRVELGDAEWTATADAPIAVGTTVKVISQNNLTMKVEEIK